MYDDEELWIARDADDSLWIFRQEPRLNSTTGGFVGDGYNRIDDGLYPDLTFENSPQLLTLKKP